MKYDKAKEITVVMNKIEKCETYLRFLAGRSYPDEFTIYYRDIETYDMEEDVLELIIKHYQDKLDALYQELHKL